MGMRCLLPHCKYQIGCKGASSKKRTLYCSSEKFLDLNASIDIVTNEGNNLKLSLSLVVRLLDIQ